MIVEKDQGQRGDDFIIASLYPDAVSSLKLLKSTLLLILLHALPAPAQETGGILARLEPLAAYRGTENRDLETWKREISDYALRHYGVRTHENKPARIILHYTATEGFPFNLLDSRDFAGERPGLASHFVVEERDGEVAFHQILHFKLESA